MSNRQLARSSSVFVAAILVAGATAHAGERPCSDRFNLNDPACSSTAEALTTSWLNLPGASASESATLQSQSAVDMAQAGVDGCSGALAMNSEACMTGGNASVAAATSDTQGTASLAVNMTMQAGNLTVAQSMVAGQSQAFNASATPNAAQMFIADNNATAESTMTARWNQLEANGLVPGLDALSQMTSPTGMMEARDAASSASPMFGGVMLGSDPTAAVASWGVAATGGDALVGGNNAASGIVSEQGATLGDLLADNPSLAAVLQNPMYTATPDPLADRGGMTQLDSNDPWMQALNNNIQRAGNPTSHASTPSPEDDGAGAASDRSGSTSGATSTGGVGRPSGVDFTSPDWE